MKESPITIKDIAKALNLSVSSVSRALKGSHKISQETIQLVRDYAHTHNYKPNLQAQSLRSQKSRSIGLMLCSVPNNFFAEVINGIESIASAKEYHVIITQSQESYNKELKGLEHLEWRSVDGLLVSVSAETKDVSHFEAFLERGTPIVFFDRIAPEISTHQVLSDDLGGAYQLVQHMIASGFKRIAHITSSPYLSITQRRLKGHQQALAEAGIPYDEQYTKFCSHGGMEDAEINEALDELLALPSPPDAIFGASDRLTIKCFSSLKKRGILIPDQIALAGFSNFGAPELFCPSLTTIVQPAFDMGKVATELLLKLIESKRPVKDFETVVLPTQLVIRDSTSKKQ